MKLRRKLFNLLLSGIFLTGQWGCAIGPTVYPKPEPLLEEYRGQLGTIGVTTGKEVPVIQFGGPPPPPTSTPGVLARMGQGASDGAEKTGGWMREVCKEGWNAPGGGGGMLGLVIAAGLTAWCILALPVAILGGLGGGIYGAFPSSPESPAYMENTEAILLNTLANYPIQENFQNSFLKEARARTSHTFVVVPKEGSQASEKVVGQGVDIVLELSVQRIWLKRVGDREEEINPPMVLVLFVRARLMRAAEKTVWYDQTFVHERGKHLYQGWPHFNRLQNALEKAYQSLAKQMVKKLFLPKPTT